MATAVKEKKKARTNIKLQPIGDRVVVEREAAEEKTSGGILIPDAARDKPSRGTVLAVGDGKVNDNGTRTPLQVEVGDRVLFTSYGPQEIRIGDENVLLLSERDILAILGD